MEGNKIIVEKDLISTIMSLPDTEEKKELIAYLVTEKIKKSIEGDSRRINGTLKVNVSIKYGYFSIFFKSDGCTDLEEDFSSLLYIYGEDSLADVKRDLVEKISGINELGAAIYEVFRDCERYKSEKEKRGCTDYFTSASISPLRIPAHLISQLVKVEYVEEIAEFVAEYLAKLFLEYFKIPEVHEHLATYELPETVKSKLKERGVDPKFHVEYYAEKEKGPRNLAFYVQTEVSDKLRDTLNFLFDHKLTREFVLLDSWVTLSDSNRYFGKIYNLLMVPQKSNSERTLWYKLFKYEYLKYDILKIVEEIKKDINKRFRFFDEYGYSNLFLSAMYKPLNYTAPTIEIPLQKSLFGESKSIFVENLHIERKFFLDDIHIQFLVKVPHGYRIERLLIDFNTVEGKRYIRINVSEKTRKAFSAVIKVDRKTVSNRIARLIAGDASVIDEVEEIDQRLIREITDQLRASIVKRMIEDERKEREIEEREREKEEELNNILVGA
jgi:hypothetical protein